MKKIGLVLSGGGVRGFAHLGAIKALEEHGIKPTVISGTSAGALVGALYASGYSIDTIIKISKKIDFFSMRHMQFGKAGIFNMKSFETLIEEHIPGNAFESLKIPLHVAATDIINTQITYFSSGCLSKAVMASACIPMVYEPVKHNDTFYLDGGILDNFPIKPLVNQCDLLVGVFVNSLSKKLEHIHMKDMVDRSFHLALSSAIFEKSKQCDLFIAPENMSRFGMFDMDNIDEIIEVAYNFTIPLLTESGFLSKL